VERNKVVQFYPTSTKDKEAVAFITIATASKICSQEMYLPNLKSVTKIRMRLVLSRMKS
jgi:hypothetical protein